MYYNLTNPYFAPFAPGKFNGFRLLWDHWEFVFTIN